MLSEAWIGKKNRIQPTNCSDEYRSVWYEDQPGKKEEYIESNMLDLDTNLNGEYEILQGGVGGPSVTMW